MAKAVENWPAKVLSLGLAIILFVFHRMSILEDRFFSVPLNIEHRGQLMPSSSYPRMVRVSLRGEANSIYPILEEDIDVFVDIEKFEVPGLYTVPVQWRKLGTARAVEPLQITVDPAEITVSLDHRISKLIPLTASFRGQPEAGHAMTSYTLDPAQVIVDGPAELIWDISEIFTEPIDLDGRKSDFVVSVHILNRDNLIIIRGSGTTEFQGNISPIIPVRNIANVPIVITGIAHGLSAELQTRAAGVRLEGYNQDAVSNFRPSPDFLKVDCMGITEPGTYVLRVSHGSAEDMNIRVEPEEVAVVISHAGEGEQY
jgi:YbbR domain-containing protein